MASAPDLTHPTLSLSVQLARACSRLALYVQNRMVTSALRKDDRSPVTVADFAVQALAAHHLRERFPDIPLMAEESSEGLLEAEGEQSLEAVAEHLQRFEPGVGKEQVLEWIDRGRGEEAGRFWVLDPIDGTKGFLRNAQYAVALALVEEGEVRLGVLGCPRLNPRLSRKDPDLQAGDEGCLLIAARGQGAWRSPLETDEFEPIAVSDVTRPEASIVVRSVVTGHTNVGHLDLLMESLNIESEPILLDSQAKYGLLACGAGDFLTRLISPARPDYREKIWDQAAGALLIEEAGGRITDLDGVPLDFTTGRELTKNRGILASNGRLHDELLAALSTIEEST